MRKNNLDVDPDILAKAIKDVLTGQIGRKWGAGERVLQI